MPKTTKKDPGKKPAKKNKAVAKAQKKEVAHPGHVTQADLNAYLLGTKVSEKLNTSQVELFYKTAKAHNLNPLKREIYAVPYDVWEYDKDKGRKVKTGKCDMAIVTGYEVYLKKAEAAGKNGGYQVEFEEEEVTATTEDGFIMKDKEGNTLKKIDLVARIKIHRKDFNMPFIHEVYLSEYFRPTTFWKKSPRTMLRKVAICQGYRLAFPENCGRLPYISEEVPQISQEEPLDITPPKKDDKREDDLRKKIVVAMKKIGYKKKDFADFVEGAYPEKTWEDLEAIEKEAVTGDFLDYVKQQIDNGK